MSNTHNNRPPSSNRRGPAVLIILDEIFQRRLTARNAREAGACEVLEAIDRWSALDLLSMRQQPVDLVLCDAAAPGNEDLGLIRRLAKVGGFGHLALVGKINTETLHSVQRICNHFGVHLIGNVETPVHPDDLTRLMNIAREFDNGEPGASLANREFTLAEIKAGLSLGEFVPFFQPKFDVRQQRVVGAEALARWVHPEFGVIGADAFVPALEKAGELKSLTLEIVAKAARACARWQQRGAAFHVSINLPACTLADSHFVDDLCDRVENAGVEPCAIIFEITASAACQQLDDVIASLTRLRMRGFGLSIDDFGHDCASLDQLNHLPLTEIKIDGSLVRSMCDSVEDRALIKSAIDMGHHMGISTVAKGVETQAQSEIAESLGCDMTQGYMVSSARPENELMAANLGLAS